MPWYSILKLIHIAAVIVFLGNIFTGLYWMSLATKTKDVRIIDHTISGIIKSDKWFTIPGVIIITGGGIIAALHGNIPLLKTGWIFWSIIMFTTSGIAFSWKVAPLQKRIYQLVTGIAFTANEPVFWKQFYKLYREWEFWGALAILTPVVALCMMVLKIPAVNLFLK